MGLPVRGVNLHRQHGLGGGEGLLDQGLIDGGALGCRQLGQHRAHQLKGKSWVFYLIEQGGDFREEGGFKLEGFRQLAGAFEQLL